MLCTQILVSTQKFIAKTLRLMYLVCNEVKKILDLLKVKFSLDSEKCFDIRLFCVMCRTIKLCKNECDKSKAIVWKYGLRRKQGSWITVRIRAGFEILN